MLLLLISIAALVAGAPAFEKRGYFTFYPFMAGDVARPNGTVTGLLNISYHRRYVAPDLTAMSCTIVEEGSTPYFSYTPGSIGGSSLMLISESDHPMFVGIPFPQYGSMGAARVKFDLDPIRRDVTTSWLLYRDKDRPADPVQLIIAMDVGQGTNATAFELVLSAADYVFTFMFDMENRSGFGR